MTQYDMVDLIHNNYTKDARDTILEINELREIIEKDPKGYIYDLSVEVEDFAMSNNLCPFCGEKLESARTHEYSEYQGALVGEEISILECSDETCSFTTKYK